MCIKVSQGPRVVHRTPGRLRVHLASWAGLDRRHVEDYFFRFPGVTSVRGEPLTGNVLIRFDPQAITEADLLTAAARIAPADAGEARSWPVRSAHARRTRQEHKTVDLWSVALRDLLRKALLDALWTLVANVEPFGLPLGTLRAVQVGLDVVTWGAALKPLLAGVSQAFEEHGSGRQPQGGRQATTEARAVRGAA